MDWDFMNMHGYYFGGGFMWLWFLILMLVVVLMLVPVFKNKTEAPPTQDSALDILAKRFARGEISEEEYKRMKHTLGVD
jgi:putative membrane protein